MIINPLEVKSEIFTFLLISFGSIFLPFYMTLTILVLSLIALLFLHYFDLVFKKPSLSEWSLILFIGYAMVISIASSNWIGLLVCLAYVLYFFFFKAYSKVVNREFFERLIDIAVMGSVITGIYSIFEVLAVYPEWDYRKFHIFVDNHYQRIEAIFGNPNYFAMVLEFLVIIGLYRFIQSQKIWQKLFYSLLMLSYLIDIFFTGSRTSLLVLVVSFFAFFYIIGYKKEAIISGLSLAGFFFLASFYGMIPRMEEVVEGFADREFIWVAALKSIRDHWLFGVGPMGYFHTFSAYTSKVTQHAHNIFLEFLISYGLIGSLIFLPALLGYGKVINDMRRYKNLRLPLALIFSFLLITVVHGLTDVTIFWLQTSLLFLFFIMAAPNLLKEEKTFQKK